MITEGILSAGITIVAQIMRILPNVTMPDWYANSTIVFQAVSAIGNLPIISTLFVVFSWIIAFELIMLGYRILIMLASWARLIGGSGNSDLIR